MPPTTAGSRVSDKIATSDPFERFAIQGSLIVHAREFNRLRQLLMPEEGDNGPPSHVVWREDNHAATSRPAGVVSRRSRNRTRPWSIRASGTAKVGTMTSG